MKHKELFLERYIKMLIRETGGSQEEVLKHAETMYKEMLDGFADGEPIVVDHANDRNNKFIDCQFLGFLARAKPFVMSETLLRILDKTSNNIKVEFIWKKGLDVVLKGFKKISETGYYAIDVQAGSLYGFVTISKLGIYVCIPAFQSSNSDSLYFHMQPIGTDWMHLTVDEIADRCTKYFKADKKDLTLLWKSFSYILCSGQPDLREVKEETRINSPKKIRKLNITKPIIPVIKVGLGFEKTPMYLTDEWERRGHFRLQPYGPKGNPTHHDLIWIPNTIAKRRLPHVIRSDLEGNNSARI